MLRSLMLVMLCTPATANAQWWSPASSTPHPSIARIAAKDPDGTSYGSGTLVALNEQTGLVLTNWHVVRDHVSINVEFPDGFRSPARLVKSDQDWDLAALVIWKPKVLPVTLSRIPPKPGDMLTIAGYGSGKYRSVAGRCTQYVSPGEQFPYEMVELNAQARNGDSGGPILNEQGHLAGVLFGAARGTTSGSHSGRVAMFLRELQSSQPQRIETKQAVPSRVDTQFAQQPEVRSVDRLQVAATSPRPVVEHAGEHKSPQVDSTMSPVPPLAPQPAAISSGQPSDRTADNESTDQLRSQSFTSFAQIPPQVANPSKPNQPANDPNVVFELGDLIGQSPFEQFKSFFALVGLAITMGYLLRSRA